MRLLLIPVFLIVVPIILGLPWCCTLMKNNLKRTLACLPMGYFLEFAIFQLLTFPLACLLFSFSSLCITFICVLCVCCAMSCVWLVRNKRFRLPRVPIRGWTVAYLVIFLCILAYQLWNAVTLDRTAMSHDDSVYVALANDALTQNALFQQEPLTGLGASFNIHRAMQSSVIFPSFLTYVSGVSVVIMSHTILDIYYLLLAYIVYAFLGSMLFKRIEDILVFLIIMAVLLIFGNFSMYSPSMRLLGLNYVGKAILAVVFFPFLFALLVNGLSQRYCVAFGVTLLLLSVAACGLTLFGTVTMVGNVTMAVGLSMLFSGIDLKKTRYILWSAVMPVFYAGVYFVVRYIPI